MVADMKLTEILDSDLMISQLQKLIDRGRLAVQAEHGLIFTVTRLKITNSQDGRKFLRLFVIPLPTDSAFNFLVDVDKLDQWELKKDEARFILRKKRLEENQDERPLLVSMLAKVLRARFKQGSHQVRLEDDDLLRINAPISGYSYRPNALSIFVDGENGSREIVYLDRQIEDGSLKLTLERMRNGEKAWILKFTPPLDEVRR